MTTYRLTGKTFPHRERLKELRGLWDASAQNWRFEYLKPAQLAELKNLVGCMVTEDGMDADWSPAEPESAEDFIERIDRRDATPGVIADRKSVIYGDDQTYFNYFKDKNPVSFFGFSSLGEMVKFIDAIPYAKRSGERNQGFDTSNAKWYGSINMTEAMELARDGWTAGTENASKVLEFLDLENATQRRRAYSVAGGNVSVGRLLASNPAHMVRRPKLPGHRAITLFVENTASASINADMLVIRAAIVAAFADILEDRGYSCTIVAVTMQGLSFANPGAQTAVTLKHAGEKLNLNDVVFALGHPSFLRRFNFACVSQADELRRIWDNQGFPQSAFGEEMNRNEFYVPHLQSNLRGDNFRDIAKRMLPLVKPDGLPLEFTI